MDDINFLGSKSDKKRKKAKRKGPEMEWSKPDEKKIVASGGLKEFLKPGKLFGWFAFPKKERKKTPLPIKASSPSKPFDKRKTEFFRQEVLKAIKENGSRKVTEKPSKEKEFRPDKKLTFLPHAQNAPTVSPEKMGKSSMLKQSENAKRPEHKLIARGLFWWAKLWRRKSHQAGKREGEIFKPARVERIVNKKNGENGLAAVSLKDEREPIIEIKKKAEKEAPLFASNKENEKEWESSSVLETNLIKGEFVAFFQLKKNLALLSVFVILACLAVAGIYGGLTFWDKQKRKQVAVSFEKIDNLNKAIGQLEEEIKQRSTLEDNLKLAGELLDGHIYWTNFFKFLEDITIPNVYYNGISFNNKGEYSLSARTKNFRAILDQVNIMRLNEYVKEAGVSGGKVSVESDAGKESESQKKSAETTGVNFTLNFSIDPVLFAKGPRIASIEPQAGAVGQYITISGINFRSYNKSKSFVKFYDSQTNTSTPADVNFPQECQNDWWRNSYIIVKVPALAPSNWRVIVGNEEGETEYAADFQVTAGSPGPGICLLDPSYGFEGQVMDVYGDNFGQDQGVGGVEYYGEAAGKVIYWSDQKITVEAPTKVQSGLLKIKTNSGGLSNGLLYKRIY